MKYKVKDADSESQQSVKTPESELEKKLERTVRYSLLAIALLGLALAGVVFCAAMVLLRCSPSRPPCLTEDCVTTASRVLASLNRKVAPCDDFFEFACGGWIKQHPIPEYATSWDQLTTLAEQLIKDLREILEEEDKENMPNSVMKAKALYRTCVNTDKLESLGTIPISRLLTKLGFGPLPPSAATEGFAWATVAGRARRSLGLAALLSLQVTEDVRNTSQNRIIIEQVAPGFSERYLLHPERFQHEVDEYHKYITATISIADPIANASGFADNIIWFSKELAKVMTPNEVRRSGSHMFHELSIAQLINGSGNSSLKWNQDDWKSYIKEVFTNTSVQLDYNKDRIIVMDLEYLQKMSKLLAETNPLIVEQYLWWSVFSTVAPMTLNSFRELGFEFSRAVFGLRQRAPRWKSCASNVNANFGFALSFLYVRKNFDNASKDKAIEMVEDVREAFAETVSQLEWMDASTRARTLRKLNAIRNYVGFPSWIFDREKLDKHYSHMTVIEGELFETYLRTTYASVNRSLSTLHQKPDRNRWVATATTVNAFYSAMLNSITFPAGILKPPFYGNGIEALNYGSIGAIMGHEVTHGFDDQGRRYDEEGNLRQWWSTATLERYMEKVQCIIDQYNNYHMAQLPNYTVHGFNTQGENIADNGGLRAALRAYRRHQLRASADRLLPALPQYSPTQLFFLGYAQTWCGNTTNGALKSRLVEGVHSPNKVRVIGTLSNSHEFADAWQCPLGSPMNPPRKCILW